MYQALYRKWRPKTFDDVLGQEHITNTLKNQIISERVAHAYLFCGTRGTGKTSTAKIFSRAVNCTNKQHGNPCNICETCKGISDGSIMDVIEIDAASNNGVDNVREIREEVAYAPSHCKYKVYIIDEVHMLSSGAFNALLKTLEEPPAHVIFILATTEAHKIPATILSRCQRFDFKRITIEDIVERLEQVVTKDHIQIDLKSLRLIARAAEGSMRDALSILDQCISFNREIINYEDVASILGIVDDTVLFELADSIVEKNSDKAVKVIDSLIRDGRDIVYFIDNLIEHFRNLLLSKVVEDASAVLDMSEDSIERLKAQSVDFTQEKIINCIKVLTDAYANAKWAANPRLILEVAVIRLCEKNLDMSTEALLDRIATLEDKIASGNIQPVSSAENKAKKDIKPTSNPKASLASLEIAKETASQKEIAPAVNAEGVKKVLRSWPEIVGAIRKEGKVGLFGNLSGAKVQLIGESLAIVFPNSYKVNKQWVAKKENIEFIEQIIMKLIGEKIKVKCFVEEEIEGKNEHTENSTQLEQLLKLKEELGDTMKILDE